MWCRYGASFKDLVLANFHRMLILQARTAFILGIRLFQLVLMAVVVATLFLQLVSHVAWWLEP